MILSPEQISTDPIPIILVGLGKRSSTHAIPNLRNLPSCWTLVAACDEDRDALNCFKAAFPSIQAFDSLSHLLDAFDAGRLSRPPTCAYVAVPPRALEEVLPRLLMKKMNVINEKPAATTPEQLAHFQLLARKHSVRLFTASQTRYGQRMTAVSYTHLTLPTKRIV